LRRYIAGKLQAIAALVRNGANPDQVMSDGSTTLMKAAAQNRPEVFQAWAATRLLFVQGSSVRLSGFRA
jgi:ankyrin repeat protein